MKTKANFFTWRKLIWIALTFFTWFLERIFDKLFSKIETMANNILTFIGHIGLTSFEKLTGILCLLTLFIMWLFWYFKEYKRNKNQYFNLIEQNINSANVNIRYLKGIIQNSNMNLDLLVIAENFSEEEMDIIGLDSDQKEKAKQYFKQKYGHEPNRDNPKS
ncbi:MAG: hypothetical protein WCG82_08360 [Bacteroidota bacterium]